MTIVDSRPAASLAAERPRKRWTREECRIVADAGLLSSENRFELIEGDLLERMGQNQPHVFVMFLVCQALAAAFGADFVQSQAPIALSDISEPEPDAFVTRNTHRHYFQHGTPGPAEVLLVAEVSDTTLGFDTTVKADLYARAGIPEYWVVDIAARVVIVHRQPGPAGYADRQTVSETGTVAPLAAFGSPIRVADLLP
jgi:Uma2 family endonuclease